MSLLQEQGRLLTNQRNERAQLATLYQRSGTDVGLKQAASLRGDIEKLDGDMLTLRGATITLRQKVEESETYLQGMQGIEDFSTSNDPRRLSAVWSLYAGVPIGIQPRSDGTFNIIVNGVRTKSGVSERDITNTARLAFDQAYRQQSATAGAAMNKFMSEERYKTTLKIQEGNASELAKMIKDIAVENVKGNSALALEWAKANYGYDIKPTGSGDGTVIIKPPNSQPYIFNPTGRTIEIDGIKVQSNAAQLISGLPIATQQRLNAVR
jgi:hypothetical protein